MSLFDKFASKKSPLLGKPASPRVPPGQTLTPGFPVLTYGETPIVTREAWSCRAWGLLPREHTFSWADLMAMPQSTITCDIHCVTSWSKLDTQWTGVRFRDFLAAVELACGKVPPQAKWVMQHCHGGYTTNTALADMLADNVMLAHTYDGRPLEAEHGGPVRFVLPKLYFWKSAKWLNAFEFMDENRRGFWELNGYHNNGDPFQEERYSWQEKK